MCSGNSQLKMEIGNAVKESMRFYGSYFWHFGSMALITFSLALYYQETRKSLLIFALMATVALFVCIMNFVFPRCSHVFDEIDRIQNSYELLPRTNPDACTNSRLPTSNASGRGDSSATTAKTSNGKKGEPQPSASGLQTAITTASASKAKKTEPIRSTSGLQGAFSTSAPASTARAESVPSPFELQGAPSIITLTSTEKKEPVHSTSELQTASSSSASEKQPDALTLALEIVDSLEFETCENQPMLPSTGLTGFLQEASEIQAAATEECVIVMPIDLESELASEVQSISSGSSTEDFEVVHPHMLPATATAKELH